MKGLFKNELIVNRKNIIFFTVALIVASSPFFFKWSKDVTDKYAVMVLSKILLRIS